MLPDVGGGSSGGCATAVDFLSAREAEVMGAVFGDGLAQLRGDLHRQTEGRQPLVRHQQGRDKEEEEEEEKMFEPRQEEVKKEHMGEEGKGQRQRRAQKRAQPRQGQPQRQ